MSGITEITGGLIKKTLGKRNQNSHKGDYGHTAVVAGSLSYTGAAAFCSRAASRVGSGLVTLCSVNEVCSAVARRCGK